MIQTETSGSGTVIRYINISTATAKTYNNNKGNINTADAIVYAN